MIYICSDDNVSLEIEANTYWEAAESFVEGGDYNVTNKTELVDVDVKRKGDPDWGSVTETVHLHPIAPKCDYDEGHSWVSHLAQESGHGCMCFVEICRRCGLHKITDEGATNSSGARATVIEYSKI